MAGGGQFNNPYQQPGGAYGQAIGQGQMRPNMRGMNPNQRALQRQIGTMGPGAGMAPQPAFGQANMYSTLPMPQQPLGTAQPTQADLYAQQMMGNSGGAGYNMPQLTQQQMAERMQQQMPLTGGGMMPPPRQIGAAGQIAGLAPALGIAGLPRM